MLEKFSVRKPFTVLVGVLLITVLGIVSVMSTPTDLLPAMDLPISAVFTMHMGATPEQVEREVSVPLETRLSTLSGIQNVNSMSFEHFSIIILEFTPETNMDSASLEIREALDMMTLPDGVSRPMTIRMNPEMMPMMMANIYIEGSEDMHEISELALNYVAPALEGVPGVAVVNLAGLVQNQLNVIICSDLIYEANTEMQREAAIVLGALEAQMAAEFNLMFTGLVDAQIEEIVQGMILGGLPEEAAREMAEENREEIEFAILFEMGLIPLPDEPVYPAEHNCCECGVYGAAEAEMDISQLAVPADMLTIDTIAQILMFNHFSMPAGIITDEGTDLMVRVGDRFESVDDVRNLMIFDPNAILAMFPGMEDMDFGLTPVRLSQVAYIFETDNAHLNFTQVNNNDAIMLSVQRQSEFTTADVASAVRDRLDALVEEHPGFNYVILMDQGEMIDIIVGSVLNSLLWGALLAIVVLLLFLRDIRPTLIVAISIPVSLMLAFTLMYFTGVSLNMVSMGGLALAVGMLVDNSIVVIENIYRMRESTGRSIARAAVSGAKQVSGAIMAATFTTIALFVPIIFTHGITRQIFADFVLTITYALLASLIIALTVVPSASAIMLKNVKKEQEGSIFTRFINFYEKALRGALRFKWVVLAVMVAAFVLSFWGISRMGMQLFPPMDMPQVSVTVEMPEGSTFDETVEVAQRLSQEMYALEYVETIGVSVGGGMMEMMAGAIGMGGMGGMGGGTTISINILLCDDRDISFDDINAELRAIVEAVDPDLEANIGGGAMDMMEMMAGAPIDIRVEGTELDHIRDTAIALSDLIREIDGTMNVTDMAGRAAPELRIIVRKDDAMARGITVAQVFGAAMAMIAAPEESINMTLDGTAFEVIVSEYGYTPPARAEIEGILIPNMMGELVPLYQVADVRDDYGFTAITRINRSRFVTITGGIEDGFNVGLINAEIEELLETFEPYGDTRIIIGGEAEAIADAMGDLMLMLALGLIFTYLIMVAQFQSLSSPFVIMFTIPLAFTGGFIALMLAGMPLSVVAMIGLIVLSGVAVNNGIVIVSRITQMRWEGMPKREAIVDAGRKRIRPVLMTAISTIFAMSVLAIGIGEGTEMMQPMAIATIGGLLYATITTLFVVPIIYDILHRNKDITVENLEEDETAPVSSKE